MLNLGPKRKVLSSLRTLLSQMSDILLRSHIHAVRVLPVRIIFIGKVNNLASNILTYGTINEVGELSHAIFATKKYFHTLMAYLLMQHRSLCFVGISTIRQINMYRVRSRVIPSCSTIFHITQISIWNLIHRSVNCSLSTTQFVGSVHYPVAHLFLLVCIPVVLEDRAAKSCQYISARQVILIQQRSNHTLSQLHRNTIANDGVGQRFRLRQFIVIAQSGNSSQYPAICTQYLSTRHDDHITTLGSQRRQNLIPIGMRNLAIGISTAHYVKRLLHLLPVNSVSLQSGIHPWSHTAFLHRQSRKNILHSL